MKLQEAKEEIAKDTIYKTWENIRSEMRGTDEYVEYLEKAAELYARARWMVACEAQKQICWSQLDLQANQNKVIKAPLAVFDAW